MKIRHIPNFCGSCGKPVPDSMKLRKTNIEETEHKVRIPVCRHCGNDLVIMEGTEKMTKIDRDR